MEGFKIRPMIRFQMKQYLGKEKLAVNANLCDPKENWDLLLLFAYIYI